MSIPRVLVLSILLLPPQADAQQMKDPFSRIRQTLKYWRRIYNMYHEEMALGYCWAEYFLQLGENMETMAMSSPMTLIHSHFGATKGGTLRRAKGDRIVKDRREDWLISLEGSRKHVRRKRSSGISSTIGETSIIFGKVIGTSHRMRPPVQKSAKSIDCHRHASRHVRRDKRREFSGSVDVMSTFSLSSLSNASRDANLEGFAKNRNEEGEGRFSSSELEDFNAKFDEYSTTGRDLTLSPQSPGYSRHFEPCRKTCDHKGLKFTDYYQLAYSRVQKDKSRKLSDFSNITNLLNTVRKVILKISREIAKSVFNTKNPDPRSAISVQMESKSNSRSTDSFLYFERQKSHQSSKIDLKGCSTSLPHSPNKSQKISETQKSAVVKELSTGKSASSDESSKATKVYLKSIDASHRSFEFPSDDVGRSSFSLSSSNITEDGRLPVGDGEKVVKTPSDSKFKGSRAESGREVSEESKDLEENSPRKVLYLKTRHAASAGSPQHGFSFQLSHLGDQRSLVGRSLRRIVSLNDSEDSQAIEQLSGIREDDFRDKTKFDLSSPDFQEVGQHLEVSEESRNKIRHTRDVGDQIRDSLARPLPLSFAMRSFDKFVRYFPSWVHATPKRSARKSKIKSHINSRNNGKENERRNWRTGDIRRAFVNSGGLSSKYYTNLSQTNKQLLFIPIGTKEFPKPRRIYSISSFSSNPWTLGSATNHMLPRKPTKDDWWKQDSYKQSLTMNNRYRGNRYQGAKSVLLLEKSTPEETGEKEPIQYPEGGPSLLPNSYRRFIGDYGRLTSGTSRNSKPSLSSRVVKEQGRRSSNSTVETRGLARSMSTVFSFREAFIQFLRAMGFFVQVGRQIMDYVESNSALTCTKDYVWSKVIQWIDA